MGNVDKSKRKKELYQHIVKVHVSVRLVTLVVLLATGLSLVNLGRRGDQPAPQIIGLLILSLAAYFLLKLIKTWRDEDLHKLAEVKLQQELVKPLDFISFEGKLSRSKLFWIAAAIHLLNAISWLAIIVNNYLSTHKAITLGSFCFIFIVSVVVLYICPIDEHFEVFDGTLTRKSYLRPWRNYSLDLRRCRWIGYGFHSGKKFFIGIDSDIGAQRVHIPSIWDYRDLLSMLRQDLKRGNRKDTDEEYE